MKSAVVALAAAGVAAAVLPLSTGPAAADPAVAGTFAVPGGVKTNGQISPGPDGNMWMPVAAGNDFVRIGPDGTTTPFDATNITNPTGMTQGPDGNMWVTQTGGVASFSPAAPTVGTAVPIPGLTDPRAIVTGPDGNLWTTNDNLVYRITPAGVVTPFTMAGVNQARWITASSTRIWVAYLNGDKIMEVDPATGTGTPHTATGGLQGIAAGANDQIGFTQSLNAPNYIGRLTPGSAAQETQAPLADPFGITFGADQAYWVAQFGANNLGRLTTDGTYTTPITFPAGSGPRQLAVGPGNALWVSLETSNQVVKIAGVDPAVIATIIKGPKKTVKTRKAKAKVRFTFTSSPAGAAFQCRIKKSKKFTACKSPKTYKLTPGKYRFAVRAVLAGADSAKPAVRKFKVVRK